jgi:indole-3-glycerol phosphate synthase / phosphoribosylanthranilate isomerase
VDRSARVLSAVLQPIVALKADEVAALRPRRAALRAEAAAQPAARPFATALRRAGEVAVIAEFKRRSPSAGWLRPGADAATVAAGYAAAGAAALSVLTDARYFGGSLDDVRAVRAAVDVPVLRKDFVIDELQLAEARAAGADAVLLIARILPGARLGELYAAAGEHGLGVLVEVHDEAELERAVEIGARVVGVNNRDLDALTTDRRLALRLAPRLPADRVAVAESGLRDAGDVEAVGLAGCEAVLVGESLLKTPDPAAALAALVGRPRRARGAGVKICGVCRAADARAALAAGADYVGVIVEARGPRRQGVAGAAAVLADVPPGRRVGVFADVAADAVLAAAAALELGVIQLHGDESAATVAAIRRGTGAAIWKATQPGPASLAELAARYGPSLDALLVDGGRGGSGERFDWAAVGAERGALGALPLVAAGGLDAHNVAAAIRALGPAIVDVSSGVEEQLGAKSEAKMKAFVAAARSAATSPAFGRSG